MATNILTDVIVSRAGANCDFGIGGGKKPVLLVPFPFAAEDHQTKNLAGFW